MLLAAFLALRAFRMRQRFRTATQQAIARGDPLPPGPLGRDEYWGLGSFSGWTPDGNNRLGPFAAQEERARQLRRWAKVPSLSEAEVDDQDIDEKAPFWVSAKVCLTLIAILNRQPLSAQSLLPPPDATIEAASSGQNPFDTVRTMGPRPRPPPLIDLSAFSRARRRRSSSVTVEPPPPPPKLQREIDRALGVGEEVRVAVVIQMPREVEDEPERHYDSDEEEYEEVGWKPGMELGVWEGVVTQR